MTDTPHVSIACVSNIYIRQMHFEKAGDIEYGHSHPFDHVTFLSKGKVQISVGGESTVFTAPQMILIRKGVEHELVALEDGTEISCIHGLRDAGGDIISPDMLVTAEERDNLIRNLRD